MSELIELSREEIANGLQLTFSHQSTVTNCLMKFCLYLPPQAIIDGDTQLVKLPSLYMLAGLSRDYRTFVEGINFQEHAAHYGLVVICPDTSPRNCGIEETGDEYLGEGASYYLNATEPKWTNHYRMFDYVTEELPNLVEKHFPVIDSSRRGITGFSMGGQGALVAALKRPDLYSSVSIFAGIANLSDTISRRTNRALTEYLGPDKDKWKAWDASELLKSYTGPFRDILIDQGTDDEYHKVLKTWALVESSYEKNVEIQIRMRAKHKHDYRFIRAYLKEHFEHHARYLKAK